MFHADKTNSSIVQKKVARPPQPAKVVEGFVRALSPSYIVAERSTKSQADVAENYKSVFSKFGDVRNIDDRSAYLWYLVMASTEEEHSTKIEHKHLRMDIGTWLHPAGDSRQVRTGCYIHYSDGKSSIEKLPTGVSANSRTSKLGARVSGCALTSDFPCSRSEHVLHRR